MIEPVDGVPRFMHFLAFCWSLQREARFAFGRRVEESVNHAGARVNHAGARVNRAEARTNRAEERASCVEGLGTRSASCAEGRISSGCPKHS